MPNVKGGESWYLDSDCEENATKNRLNFSKLLSANIPMHYANESTLSIQEMANVVLLSWIGGQFGVDLKYLRS